MLRNLFVLVTVLASIMACGSGGGSPSDSSAGGNTGGNDSPTGGGGGDGLESADGTCPLGSELRPSAKADGTHRCYPATSNDGGTQAGGDGGNLGNGGSGGSTGGEPGLGGSTGGTGGSIEPMMPACPDEVGDMSMDSPCLLAGGWTEDLEADLVNGHITITVSPGSMSSQMYNVSVKKDFHDELDIFVDDFNMQEIPFEQDRVDEITGEEYYISFSFSPGNPDYMILGLGERGNPDVWYNHFFRD